MAEPWVLVDPGALVPGPLALEPDEGRHVTRVLRLGPGAAVTVSDGNGQLASAVVRVVRRDRVEVEVGEVRVVPRPQTACVDLGVSVLHTAAMDWAVQKAVEVGVRAFVPLIGARSQAGDRTAVRRLEHWRRVARQAIKQCRRVWEMEVREPIALADLPEAETGRSVVVADPEGTSPERLGLACDVLLVVGPEGGFDEAELACARERGWPRVRLGPHVMRAETAAVVGAAMLGALLTGEVGSSCGEAGPGPRYTASP